MAQQYAFTSNGDAVEVGGGASNTLQSITAQSLTWGTLTVICEGSLDHTNWVQLFAQPLDTGTAAAFSITATNKLWRVDVTGITYVRFRCSAFTSTGTLAWDYGMVATRV